MSKQYTKQIQQIQQHPGHLVSYLRALDILQGEFEVTNLLPGKILSHRKVIPIPITQ